MTCTGAPRAFSAVQRTVSTHYASKDKARTSRLEGDSNGLNSEAGFVHVAVTSPVIEVRSFPCVILDNDQLDTHLLYFTISLLQSSTCFEHYMLIIRRLSCIDAASGIVTLSQWPSGGPDGH